MTVRDRCGNEVKKGDEIVYATWSQSKPALMIGNITMMLEGTEVMVKGNTPRAQLLRKDVRDIVLVKREAT